MYSFLINSTGVLVNANYQVRSYGQEITKLINSASQVILYENLGITGWLSIFLVCIYLTWSSFLNFVNSLVIDRVGRIRMLKIGMVSHITSQKPENTTHSFQHRLDAPSACLVIPSWLLFMLLVPTV
jgi:hypothetical protein